MKKKLPPKDIKRPFNTTMKNSIKRKLELAAVKEERSMSELIEQALISNWHLTL